MQQRQYDADNKDKKRSYYERNREKRLEYFRLYYEKNKDKLQKRSRAYYKKNALAISERRRNSRKPANLLRELDNLRREYQSFEDRLVLFQKEMENLSKQSV